MANVVLLAVLAASAAALYGLLAIWTALGRGHWFVRAGVLAGAIGMLLPVPAFDLAIVFLSQSLVIVVPLLLFEAVRSATRRNIANPLEETESAASGHRFALVDLFLLTLVAAGIASLGAYLPAKHGDFWPSYVMIGAGAGVVTLAAAWAALGRRWPWFRWVLLMVVAPSVGFALRAAEVPEEINENLFDASALLAIGGPPEWFAPAVAGLAAVLIVLSLLLLQSAGWLRIFSRARLAGGSPPRSWKRRAARIGSVALLVAVSLLPGKAYFEMLCPLPIPLTETPNPNGYDVLSKLGGELEQDAVFATDDPSEDEIRAFVDANRQRLKAAHAALDLQHVVPVNYESTELNVEESIALRNLARALALQGKIEIIDHRPQDAVRSYLDAMRLARVLGRGGLLVHWLIGLAADGTGLHGLGEISGSISPDAGRPLLEELIRLDADRETAEEVLERDEIWEQHVYGWPARISLRVQGDYLAAALNSGKATASRTRLLICDLAVRLHLADHGQPPERLEQLVPKYLPDLPDDPFTGRPLIYRPQGASYLLYSTGPDLDDDGGSPIPGDVLFGDGDFVVAPQDPASTVP